MSAYVDIEKDIGSFRLKVSFEAGEEVVGLLGASGCGKSMTLRCIAGIVKPDKGVITVNGRTLFDSSRGIDLAPQERRAGLLFQNCALFPNMTVRENVCASLSISKKKDKPRYDDLTKMFFIEGLDDHYPAELSGGQQQRVALARMTASCPDIIMLDEPLSALDSYLRHQMEMELMDLFDRFGGTVLYVSHSRDEVFRLCSRVCVIHDGTGEPMQTVSDLFERPGTLASCLLSGCKNFSRAQKTGDREVLADDWGVTIRCAQSVPEDTAFVGVRAHFIDMCGPDDENAFECMAERVVDDLFSTIVTIRPTSSTSKHRYSKLRMDVSKDKGENIKKGDILWVRAAPADIMLLKDKVITDG